MLKCNGSFCVFKSEVILNESEILMKLPEGRVVVLKIVRSTNQYIMDNLQYMKSGDVYVTTYQTHGTGRYGKYWIAPRGQSICLSMYWKLYQKLPDIAILSVIVSLIIGQVLRSLGVFQIKMKWPNDLYIYNRKLAGILVDIVTKSGEISHLIIGIGINILICNCINQKIKISKNWIGLKNVGIVLNYNMLVVMIINTLRCTFKKFEYNMQIMSLSYYSVMLDYLYNKSVKLFIGDRIEYGIALGINSKGELLILDKSGKTCNYMGDNISVYLN